MSKSGTNGKKTGAAVIAGHLLTELVLAGIILCIFSLFHHVIPKLFPETNEVIEGTQLVTEEKWTEPEPEMDEPEPERIKTAWQEKFAEHFSDEIISTENTYRSPNVAVEISDITVETGKSSAVCHIADIYIAGIENFATYFPDDEFRHYGSADALTLDAESGAVISINGDYCNAQFSGVLVRNGTAYMTGKTECDICVLYCDGRMETYGPGKYDADELMKDDVWQIWKFGPALLDSEGGAKVRFNCSSYIFSGNPRSAVGYYEPGHYCFVVVDGRQNGSEGLRLKELSKLFSELGCTCAYNLDGGASAVMTFNDGIYSSPSNGGRELGDILLIREYGNDGEAEKTE